MYERSHASPPQPSEDDWKGIEENVEMAEKVERKRRAVSGEISDRTGKTKKERAEEGVSGAGKVVERMVVLKATLEQEVAEKLGGEDSPERALVSFQMKNLIAAFREDRKLEKARAELLNEEAEMLAEARKGQAEGVATPFASGEVRRIRKQLKANAAEREDLLHSTPEAFYGLHLRDLKEYRSQMAEGRIVETPYVREQMEEVASHLEAGTPVFLHGHLGSGKTELAMHTAKKLTGKPALVVSGSKHMSTAEFYGHQVLDIGKVDMEEARGLVAAIENELKEWQAKNPTASESEIELAHDRIKDAVLQTKGSGTISRFLYGPVYEAMEQGRILIIDEINQITHEILGGLNHILTRRKGEVVRAQQNSGKEITVAKGFGVIATGNLDVGFDQYVQRQTMDAAFVSRFHPVEHDYLPQATAGTPEAAAEEGKNELYQLMLAKLMDKNGNVEAPKGALEDLWRLAKFARATQEVFSGAASDAFYATVSDGRRMPYRLQKSVLSIRNLDRVLSQWQSDGFERPLSYHVWKDFIAEATVPEDKALLYQLAHDIFGVLGAEWPAAPGIDQAVSFKVKPPKEEAGDLEMVGPREVVRAAFGPAPERIEWPMVKGSPEEAESGVDQAALEELDGFMETMGARISRLAERVDRACAVETGTTSKKKK